jgi:hypothetical protein
MNITYYVCVSAALAIQHANCMRPFILSSVTCLAVPCFSTFSHKGQDFRRKIIFIQKIGLIFSTILHETFPILRRIQRDTYYHKSV